VIYKVFSKHFSSFLDLWSDVYSGWWYPPFPLPSSYIFRFEACSSPNYVSDLKAIP
jgi:hypothetical protein